jgi:hypothetical protein
MSPQIRPGHFLRKNHRHPQTPDAIQALADMDPLAASLAAELYKKNQVVTPKRWWEKSPFGYFLTSPDQGPPNWPPTPPEPPNKTTSTNKRPNTWRKRLIGASALAYVGHQAAMGGLTAPLLQAQQNFADAFTPIQRIKLAPGTVTDQLGPVFTYGVEDIKTTWSAAVKSAPAIAKQMHQNDMTRLNRDVIPTAKKLGQWVKQKASPLTTQLVGTKGSKGLFPLLGKQSSTIRQTYQQHLTQVLKGVNQTLGRG